MPQQRGVVDRRCRPSWRADLPAIMGVESEIREALTNLVFNAVDAMPEGGTLTLRTRCRRRLGRVRASRSRDTGIGMDEDTRRRCLEPFFTTKGERGTGLGLAMVYGMVQRHGADIDIESELGSGTTVAADLRRRRSRRGAGAATPPRRSQVPTGLRMLLVDDDPLLLQVAARHAGGGRPQRRRPPTAGSDGIDAFREAHASAASPSRPWSPISACRTSTAARWPNAVKAISPTTPVILLTGWGQRLLAEGECPRTWTGAQQAAATARAARGAGALLREVILPATSLSAARSPVPRPAS